MAEKILSAISQRLWNSRDLIAILSGGESRVTWGSSVKHVNVPSNVRVPQGNFYLSKGKAKRPGTIFRQPVWCDMKCRLNVGSIFRFFFFFGPFNRTYTSVMAQPIPTARIPTPGHLSGICLFKKTYVATAPWWGQHIYTNPHRGASGRGQIHCTRPMGQDQNLI